MPECLVLGDARLTHAWQLALEDLGETWQCRTVQNADAAYALINRRYVALAVILPGTEGTHLLDALRLRPPLAPPWIITTQSSPAADVCLTLPAVHNLPAWLAAQEDAGHIPRLAWTRHQQLLCLARGLMITLNVPRRLRAWDFLPDMLALCAVHPPLTQALQRRLYPLIARRHGLTVSAVERRLRLAIESTWSGASLAALERFFGHSVDPERGKPTNKEFLFRVQERLLLAAQRIA